MFGLDLSWVMPAIGAIGGIAQIASMFKKPKMPEASGGPTFLPSAQAPIPAPQSQAAVTPDESARRKGVQSMMGNAPKAGALNTLLTGPGGVSNDALNLGKSTLLGA